MAPATANITPVASHPEIRYVVPSRIAPVIFLLDVIQVILWSKPRSCWHFFPGSPVEDRQADPPNSIIISSAGSNAFGLRGSGADR